jgi:hypothetical protein
MKSDREIEDVRVQWAVEQKANSAMTQKHNLQKRVPL